MQGLHLFRNLQEIVANICVLGPAPGLVLRRVVNAATFICCCETLAMTQHDLSQVKPAPNLQDCISKPADAVAS